MQINVRQLRRQHSGLMCVNILTLGHDTSSRIHHCESSVYCHVATELQWHMTHDHCNWRTTHTRHVSTQQQNWHNTFTSFSLTLATVHMHIYTHRHKHKHQFNGHFLHEAGLASCPLVLRGDVHHLCASRRPSRVTPTSGLTQWTLVLSSPTNWLTDWHHHSLNTWLSHTTSHSPSYTHN